MTKEEFKTEYARALAKRDWRRAMSAVNMRIEFADDEDELECLGVKSDLCKSHIPKRTAWDELTAFFRRKRKVTE